MTPDASIIIPTYGRAEFLERAVASALGQLGADIEVIVVDDCSPTPATVVDDPRVRLVRHARNMGPGAARNTGLAHATGEFVLFLDDDDWFEPTRVAIGLQEITDGATMHLCATNHDSRPFRGRLTERLQNEPQPSILQAMIRRAYVLQFEPTLRVAEDSEWWIRMAPETIAVWSDQVLLHIDRHETARPNVDAERRLQCRTQVFLRHRDHIAKDQRSFLLTSMASAALLANHRVLAALYGIRAMTTKPTTRAMRVIVRSVITGPRSKN